jgi:membrane protein
LKRIKLPTFEGIKNRFLSLPWVGGTIHWSKTHSLPGFFRVPLYDVFVFVINEFKRFDLFTRANSNAFSFFLSLFPSILTLFTLTPFLLGFVALYVPALNNFNTTLYWEIQRVMPGRAGDVVFEFVQEIANEPRIGLLSFGFLLAIYFSSNGMLAMMQSFEKSYQTTFRTRGGLRKRMVAVALTGLMGLMLTSSVIFIILGNLIIDKLAEAVNLSMLSTLGVDLLRWVAILLFYYFAIAMLYRYGAATHRRFSYFSPGATLATFLSVMSSIAFSVYVDEFNRYDAYSKFYGSIATVIIVMLWIQLNALILIIGFELNASIAINRDLKAQITDD